ncbi:MAG: hypothetical protein ACW96X_06220 [Promethearchaeota archaeon]|jgi:hypothetical protein
MKIETITINLMNHTMYHAKSSGIDKMELEKKGFFSAALGYIEEHCTKNGFDIVNVHGSNNRVYELIKR